MEDFEWTLGRSFPTFFHPAPILRKREKRKQLIIKPSKPTYLFLDVRVGPEVVSDPAYLVTRTLEDFVTWVDSSKIKRQILKYNDNLDDFDLL